MRKVLVLNMLLAAVLVSGQNANAATIWVSHNALGPAPGTSCNHAGYATIQAAINAANAGDTVNVCPGSYIENVTINKANLTVSSTGGDGVTIIRAAVINSVVTVTGSNATIAGFTLVPVGSVAKYDIGVNVAIGGNASAEIAHNYIRGGRIGVNLGVPAPAARCITILSEARRRRASTSILVKSLQNIPAAPSIRCTTTLSAAACFRIRLLEVKDLTSTASITTPPGGLPFSATGTLCITTPPNCSISSPATPPT